jgi:hypothetical protein
VPRACSSAHGPGADRQHEQCGGELQSLRGTARDRRSGSGGGRARDRPSVAAVSLLGLPFRFGVRALWVRGSHEHAVPVAADHGAADPPGAVFVEMPHVLESAHGLSALMALRSGESDQFVSVHRAVSVRRRCGDEDCHPPAARPRGAGRSVRRRRPDSAWYGSPVREAGLALLRPTEPDGRMAPLRRGRERSGKLSDPIFPAAAEA